MQDSGPGFRAKSYRNERKVPAASADGTSTTDNRAGRPLQERWITRKVADTFYVTETHPAPSAGVLRGSDEGKGRVAADVAALRCRIRRTWTAGRLSGFHSLI